MCVRRSALRRDAERLLTDRVGCRKLEALVLDAVFQILQGPLG